MNTPKIVIYMSCYNHEKYVREAMDSIIGQTYSNWELFVVNDGSTDNTGKILETYKDKRIHYFDFKENTAFIGAANFLQNLVENVDAKYITTFSSDDKWELCKLEKQVALLERHPEYKCCFTWDKLIFEEDDNYKNNLDYSHKQNRSRYAWLNLFFHKSNCMNACAALLDKEVFYEIGRMNENFRQIGDYRMWLRLACKYPFYVLEEELTFYRRHANNLSKASLDTFARDANESYRTYLEIFREIDKKTFFKAFYNECSYKSFNTENEFLAAKFILLVNTHIRIYEQVALELYFEHCENQSFLKVLEEKYDYKPKNFIFLSGNGGLQFYLPEMASGMKSTPLEQENFTPAFVLLNAMQRNSFNECSIRDYTYSTIKDLYEKVGSIEDFNKINRNVVNIRQRRLECLKNKTIVFVIGQESSCNISEHFSDIICDKNNKCFVAYIPKTNAIFTLTAQEAEIRKIEGVESILLYDSEEHCLKFLEEIDIEVDIIYYIDCIGDDYLCAEMLTGYSLAVEHNCVMSTEEYGKMAEHNANVLNLINKIYTY